MAAVAFQHTPSLVPAQLFWPAKPRDGAKSPPLSSRWLPRGAAGLAVGFPMPGTRRAGLAVTGKPGPGTPPAVCYPTAAFQLATLRPRTGAPNGFLAKAAGKASEVWVFRLGISHNLTAKGIHISFPISTSLSSSSCGSFSFSAILVPEDGAAKPARVPIQLMSLFCNFFIYYLHSSGI